MGRPFEQLKQVLAGNVRELRRVKGISQEALALDAEVDRTYVSQIERSTGNPSLLVLSKLADTLGADVVDLLALGPERIEDGRTQRGRRRLK